MEGKGHGRAGMASIENCKMTLKLAAFTLLLMGFDGGKWLDIIG
jgi:hypothetical protein